MFKIACSHLRTNNVFFLNLMIMWLWIMLLREDKIFASEKQFCYFLSQEICVQVYKSRVTYCVSLQVEEEPGSPQRKPRSSCHTDQFSRRILCELRTPDITSQRQCVSETDRHEDTTCLYLRPPKIPNVAWKIDFLRFPCVYYYYCYCYYCY